MIPLGDTPKATRRRLRAFVVTALIVLAVVAVWPIKGYRIDNERFVKALGVPYLSAYPFFVTARDEGSDGLRAAIFLCTSYETSRKSRAIFDKQRAYFRRKALETVPSLGVPSFWWRDPGKLWVHGRWRNVGFRLDVVPSPDSGGKTEEEIARECLTAVLDGIDREIPGVTTFYNPPARQLWYDRGKPAVEKIEDWFRELFAP